MLKKILLVSLIGTLSLFAADKNEPNKKQSLYKNLYAGELASKYPEYFKNKESIDCKTIGTFLLEILQNVLFLQKMKH